MNRKALPVMTGSGPSGDSSVLLSAFSPRLCLRLPTSYSSVIELFLLLASRKQRAREELLRAWSRSGIMSQEPFDNLALLDLDVFRPSGRERDCGLSERVENVHSFHIRLERKAHFEKYYA